MSMKKIIAGVAAAALTVSSLAVVGVSAEGEKVIPFSFVGKTGSMKVEYSASVNIRGDVSKDEIFPAGTMNKAYTFNYDMVYSQGDNNGDKNVKEFNEDIVSRVHVGSGTTITVTGLTKANKSITVKATAEIVKDADGNPVSERIIVRDEGDSGSSWLKGHELDMSEIERVKSVSVTDTFEFSTGKYSVPSGVGGIQIQNGTNAGKIEQEGWGDTNNNHLGVQMGVDLTNWWCGFTSTTKENDGKIITIGAPYAFEGYRYYNASTGKYESYGLEIGADANGRPIYAESLGANSLRWVNDNIVQNKGAKIRINFMKPNKVNDVVSVGNLDEYPTLIGSDNPVLTPGGVGGSDALLNDITMGVNLKNTTKLQQTKNIDPESLSVEFDWDTLVQASTATVSGNVDSIAFRIQNSDNVKNNIAIKAKYKDENGNDVYLAGIKSIEIVIPEQTNVAPVEETIVVEDPVSGVKVEATPSVIRGNGGATLQAIGKLTTSNLTYEVKLLDKNSNAVQPAGEVTLTLPIPKDNQGKTIKNGTVAHGLSNGTVENLPIINIDTYKTDGFVKVATKSFSPFTITFATFGLDFEEEETTTEAPETTTEAPETTTEAPETTTEAPAQTGSTNNGGEDKNVGTGVVLAVVPAAIAAAAVVISKKRK